MSGAYGDRRSDGGRVALVAGQRRSNSPGTRTARNRGLPTGSPPRVRRHSVRLGRRTPRRFGRCRSPPRNVSHNVHYVAARREAADLEELRAFRAELYSVFGNWADTLFELVDGLAGTARSIRSVAELMFEHMRDQRVDALPNASLSPRTSLLTALRYSWGRPNAEGQSHDSEV
jgi:hypothetical protein